MKSFPTYLRGASPVTSAMLCFLGLSLPVAAAELTVMSPIALKPLFENAGSEMQRSGHTLHMVWGESGGMRADIEKGIPFNLAVLTESFIDELAKAGKLDASTKTLLVRSGIGVAIKRGATKPDLSTTVAFKQEMLKVQTVGFAAESATSRYLEQLFKRLSIADEMRSKLRPLKGTAAPYVAKGDPEIALTQISTIIPFEEVEFAGPLPPEIQLYTVFAAAASPASPPDTIKALLAILTAPSNGPLLEKVGLEQIEKAH